jgi:dolichol-phosphate mannosyltransferase
MTVIEFSRNFGHQAAICAGLDIANGDAVVMLDADLQHPPELIPTLVEKWRQGFEVAYTVRNYPSNTPILKKITATLFYRLINVLSNVQIPENAADFRLLDKKVVLQLRSLKEGAKFIRGLICWAGFTKCEVRFDAAPRHAGESKYSLLKMIRFAFDGITSFSTFPLKIATFLGVIVSAASFSYAIYAIYIRLFTSTAVPGWTSVLVAVLFLGGIQLLCLGVIGEYLGRVHNETKARPVYIARNIHKQQTSFTTD